MTITMTMVVRRVTRALRRAGVASIGGAVWLAAPCVASAQRAVVFQHGLLSSGVTWTPEATTLSALFDITAYLPSDNASQVFSYQASQTVSAVSAAGPDAIFIGHSNGGLIGRVAALPSPFANRAWGGMVTVGTAHGGAQLAYTATNGQIPGWLSGLVIQCSDAVDYYWNIFSDGTIQAAGNAVNELVDLNAQAFGDLGGLYIAYTQPVTGDMIPTSTILNTLNVQGNLTREASVLPVRVGIVSTLASNTGLMWKGLEGGAWQSRYNTQLAISGAFLSAAFAAEFYTNEDDPNQQMINGGYYLLWDASAAVGGMNDDWCFYIGAWIVNGCGPSDGIVPAAAQVYPGSNQTINVSGPSHIQETTSTQLDGQLRTLLSTTFNVPAKPVYPPPTISITGPTTVIPGATCTWASTVSGGTGPYTYDWEMGGGQVSSGSSFTGSKPVGLGAPFSLYLYVTDALGGWASTSISIDEDSGASVCPF